MRRHFFNSAVIANSKMDYCTIHWIEIYPLDSAIQLLNKWVLKEAHDWILYVTGGSVAEWSARRTRNPAVPGSIPALAICWICSRCSCPELKSSATLVNSQLVASCQLEF